MDRKVLELFSKDRMVIKGNALLEPLNRCDASTYFSSTGHVRGQKYQKVI